MATKAKKVDGGWSVTGQKVWTSDAMTCQRGLATVRTDPNAPKHKGITAMIIDLAQPGVRIQPLTEITGETLFNEVFFDNAFVPDRDVVGAVNAGWKVAMATLGNERVSIGGGSVTMAADALLDLLARHRPTDGGLARDVGALLIESYAAGALNLRQAARAVFDTGPGIEGNIAKLFGAEHAQRVAELALRIAGGSLLTGGEGDVLHDYLFSRCLTIAGGTSEVLRNLIAERILGLPREPVASSKRSRAPPMSADALRALWEQALQDSTADQVRWRALDCLRVGVMEMVRSARDPRWRNVARALSAGDGDAKVSGLERSTDTTSAIVADSLLMHAFNREDSYRSRGPPGARGGPDGARAATRRRRRTVAGRGGRRLCDRRKPHRRPDATSVGSRLASGGTHCTRHSRICGRGGPRPR